MTSPRTTHLTPAQRSVLLPTGRYIELQHVEWDGNRFYYGALDVSDYLSPIQRNAFPGYDPSAANNAAYEANMKAQGRTPAAGGSTNWFTLFVEGVARDLSPNDNGLAKTLVNVIYAVTAAAALFAIVQIVKLIQASK